MSETNETKMNPVVKAMWLEDLRSGNFRQGSGLLHRQHDNTATGHTFCCLGVLSERAVAEGVCERELHRRSELDPSFAGVYNYTETDESGTYREHHYLLPTVQKWAGLDNSDPYVTINDRRARVSTHNDDGATFEQIADAIEDQL